jgi:hypothetical protein
MIVLKTNPFHVSDAKRLVALARNHNAQAVFASNSLALIPQLLGPLRAVLRYVVHGLHKTKMASILTMNY